MRTLPIAWRGLWRRKRFSFAVVSTLAIGIAATTVMFALIQGVLLRPLPIPDPGRVMVAWKNLPASQYAHYPFGGPDVEEAARSSRLIARAAGVTSNGAYPWTAVEDGSASYVNGALVTGAFFDVLGIGPVAGRALTEADDREGAEPVVVISDALWRKRYGGSSDAIGRRMRLGDVAFTIVGVMPGSPSYPRGVEVWRTVRSVPDDGPFGDAARYEVDLIARLKPGTSLEQWRAELQGLTARLAAAAPPNFPRGLVTEVHPLEELVVGDVRTVLLLLFGAVALVLLISNANAANLMLMRAEERRREIAVRVAVGAGRATIAGELLAESLLLAVTAGVTGLALVRVGLGSLIAVLPDTVPRLDSVSVDGRVVLFTIGTACVTAIVSGVAPAIAAARIDFIGHLRGTRTGTRAAPGRRALAAAQVALAVMIVAAAGLLTRTVIRLESVDTGFAADQLSLANLAMPLRIVKDPATHAAFLEQLTARLEAAPFIAAATPVNVPPFSGNGGWDVPRVTAEGQSPDRAAANPSLNLESVFPRYFETFGIAILRGRSFTRADRQGGLPVAIVSADVAAQLWPDENPIGRRVKMGGPDSDGPWWTIVGLAAPTRYRELERQRPTLYLPAAQFLMTAGIIAVRSAAPAATVAAAVRSEVPRVDTGVHVVQILPFAESLRAPLARPRFTALVLAVFAAAALTLATIGLYAVIAAQVRGRTQEIGIRMALGASSPAVRRLVLGDALGLAVAGAAAGLVGCMAMGGLIRAMLFEVRPLDTPTLLGAALTLVIAAAAAAYVPVRRAIHIDPASLLRSE